VRNTVRQAFTCAGLATALLCASSGSASAGKTWCVGGFSFDPAAGGSDSGHGCYAEIKDRNDGSTSGWHWHNNWYMTQDGKTCYTCWDEMDDTCASHAPSEGWRTISAAECRDIGPAKKSRVKFKDPSGKYKKPEDSLVVNTRSLDDILGKSRPAPEPARRAPPPPPPPPPLPRDDQQVITPPPAPDPVIKPPPKTPPVKTPGAKKPPAPAKRHVYLKLDVSPGPYAVNDPITVTAFAYTDAGRRRVLGGAIAVYQNGQPVMNAAGKPVRFPTDDTPRGAATATFKIPAGGALTLRYAPDGVQRRGREKLLGPGAPGEAQISVGSCRLRGVVTGPADGELVAAAEKSKVVLRGKFDTLAGTASTDLGGASPFFGVEIGGVTKKVPARPDGNDFVGELELDPPDGQTDDLVVRMLGDGGQNDVCPGAPITARVTRLGIALEIETVGNCYVDRPCNLQARFVLPKGASRAAAEEFAKAPDLALISFENATQVATLSPTQPGNPETTFTGTYTPKHQGVVHLRGVAKSPAQSREVEARIEADVREPIVLTLPATLDLGTIAAGSDWPAGCQILDFTKSRGVIEQGFELVSTKPSGCDSAPALESGGLGVPLPEGLDIEMEYNTRKLRICLAEVPRCASESPDPIALTIKPKNPDFADQVATVRITWKVEGRNFLACHWWWIAAFGGGAFFLFVGFGFIKPQNFSPHDSIKMASDRKKLQRAVGRRLRELPGGRSGWYRSAATGLRDDGSATNKLRLAAVVLKAHKGDVYLVSQGGLQRVHPGTKKLEPVDTGNDGIPASKGVMYNAGSLFFQIG